MAFQWLIKGKMVDNKAFSCFKLADDVFILLINVKTYFNIHEQDKFDTQLS